MELFKSGLKSVLGAPVPGSQPTGAETIERLVERVLSSTLLDDRRDAVRALKALSKKFRVEVGAQAMDALIRVLEMDRNVSEIVGYALDTLCNIVAPEPSEEDGTEASQNDEPDALDDLGVQFTEIFIKRPENVPLLLSLLDEYDFHVRWPAVRLLTSLLVNKQRELQECVLVSPMGVSKLMDLLSESREVIRNDALLLLINLTRGNANIQKIVAFENAFERLLDIVTEEGNAEGGIVVEDCLQLLLNLLKNNTSNQNFFKEGCFVQRMTPFLSVHETSTASEAQNDTGWSAQKVSNVHLMLQIVRTLVSPSNPLQATTSCQKIMNGCRLLEQLCNILMASGVPADILTETINTVAEVIRGNHGNQEYFATVTAPCNPPRPAIVVLLMSMVNEKQPFVLRCAVLYCFQCFLHKNELGQAQIVQTLLPTSAEAGTMSAGQLLCGGLFSPDPLSNWFVAVGLMHSLVESTAQREHLLRVQLVTGAGQPPVFLIQQVTSILLQGGKVQTRIGILMLLSIWLSDCPLAVSHFLNIPTNVPYLTSQAGLFEGDDHEVLVQGLCAFLLGICVQFNDDSVPSFSKDMLTQLIAKRVGVEAFFDKLGSISKHESYSRVAQKPQLKHHHPNDVLFDYEFCRLFKSLEGVIVKAVTPKSKDALLNGPETHLTEADHKLLKQYKELIRQQDDRLRELQIELSDYQSESRKTNCQVEEMNSTIQQLKDQNALLKAQRSSTQAASDGTGDSVTFWKTRSESLQRDLDELRAQPHTQVISSLDGLNLSNGETTTNEDLQRLSEDCEARTRRITELELLNEELQQMLIAGQQSQVDNAPSSNEESIQQLENEKRDLLNQLDEAASNIKKLDQAALELETDRNRLQGELESVTKEQDDLLVLLTEQDTKLSSYKQRLKQLGEKIMDDDDEVDVNTDDSSKE